MTRNRVWQMLIRRLRNLLRQAPLRAARARLHRDPGRYVPLIDGCLSALDAGRTEEAVECLQELVGLLGDVRSDFDPRATKGSRSRKRKARAHGESAR